MPAPIIEKIHIKRAMNGAGGVNILPDYVIDYTASPIVVPEDVPFAIGELIQFEFDISFQIDLDNGDFDFAEEDTYMYFSFDLSQFDTWLTDNANPANNVIAARFLIDRTILNDPVTSGECLEINGISGDDGVISDFSGETGVDDNTWNNIDARRMPSPLWRLCFTGYEENEATLKIYRFKVTHIYLVGAYKGLIHENVFNSDNNHYLLKSNDSDIERVDSYGTPGVDLPIDESYKQIILSATSLYKGQNKIYMFFGYGLKTIDVLTNNPGTVIDNFEWILDNDSENKVKVIGKFYNIENWFNPPTTPLELNNGNLGDLDSSPTISLFANNQPISYISTDYPTDVELIIKDNNIRNVVVYLIRLTTNDDDDFVINGNNYDLIRSLVVLKSVPIDADMNTVGWNWNPLDTNKIIVGVGSYVSSPASGQYKYKFRIDSPINCVIGEKYKIVYTFYPQSGPFNVNFDMPLGSYISETFDVNEEPCYPIFGEQEIENFDCAQAGIYTVDITTDCEFEKPINTSIYETTITAAPSGFTIPPPQNLVLTALNFNNLIPGNYTVVIREIANPSNIIDTRDFSIDDLRITITVVQLSATCEDIAEGNATFIIGAPDTADLEMTLELDGTELSEYTGPVSPGELLLESLLPGDYELTITDTITSCTYTQAFTIELFEITISSTNTNCKCDGVVELEFDHPINRPLQIIWTIDNTNQTLVYNVPNSNTLGSSAELSGLCVGTSGTVKVKLVGTECEQEGSFSISGSSQILTPFGNFPHITPSCGCSTCKLFRTPIEIQINNYIAYIKEHQNKLFDQAYSAGLFGDMDCIAEKLNLINDYMYLGVYLGIIYNKIQNDIKKSPINEPFNASVYYTAYRLDCVSKYFYCQGVDINKMFDIFGLGFNDVTTTHLTNKRKKQ
jgi:hypothetical protein